MVVFGVRQDKAERFDALSQQLRAAQQQVTSLTSSLEDMTEDRDTQARRLQELAEDSERQRQELEARWKRRLADQQSRGMPPCCRISPSFFGSSSHPPSTNWDPYTLSPPFPTPPHPSTVVAPNHLTRLDW